MGRLEKCPLAARIAQPGTKPPEHRYELIEVDAPRGPATPLHRTGWAKAYYVLNGRMIVQVEDEAFHLGPGSSIAIPPGALHTFTVLSPSVKFLAISPTGAMGRFHADLDATVPRVVGPGGHARDSAGAGSSRCDGDRL